MMTESEADDCRQTKESSSVVIKVLAKSDDVGRNKSDRKRTLNGGAINRRKYPLTFYLCKRA